MCREFNTLPAAGGLFQQPASYISRMKDVLRAEAEAERIKDLRKTKSQEVKSKAETGK